MRLNFKILSGIHITVECTNIASLKLMIVCEIDLIEAAQPYSIVPLFVSQ